MGDSAKGSGPRLSGRAPIRCRAICPLGKCDTSKFVILREGPQMGSALAKSHRFEIPGTAYVVEGNGGLQKVCITCPGAVGEMYLHGAHVTSWKPAGREGVCFLSSQSRGEHDPTRR